MKHLILITVFAVIATFHLTATPIHPSPISSSLDLMEDEMSIVLNLDGLTANAKYFTIKDADGEEVFTDSVSKYKNHVKYNLAQLPKGNYTFKIASENYQEYIESVITSDGIEIVSTQSYYMPLVSLSDDKMMINGLFSGSEMISVALYNKRGELVYDWSESQEGSFGQVFSLAQLQSGSYDVVVNTDHFSQSQSIEL